MMMEASWRKANDGNGMVKWRLHTHFEILRGVPTRVDVTPNGGGEHDERAMLSSLPAALHAARLEKFNRHRLLPGLGRTQYWQESSRK